MGEIGNTYTGLSGKTKEDFGHGNAQFVTYMNVFSNPISNPKSVEYVEIDNRQNKVLYGDIFFTTSSETPEEVGMSSIWLENKENTYLNSFCFGYRLNDNANIDLHYLAYMLRASQFRSNMVLLAQGISRYNISKNKAMEISIDIPKHKSEQEKIGTILYQLDNLITLHQRKYLNLQTLKNSILTSIFSQKLCFYKEITWEQRKLSDLADIVGGGTPSTQIDEYWDGNIDWYAPAEMLGQIYANGSVRKITQLGLQKSSAKILPANKTVLFTSRAGIGKMAILKQNAATNQGFQSLVLKDKINPYFIYSMGNDIKQKAESIASGSTFLEISGKMLGNIDVYCPTHQEQQVIGTLFEKLDNLITLHQRKAKILKNIKISLLIKGFNIKKE